MVEMNCFFPSFFEIYLQDFGFYANNAGVQGSKWGRNGQKGVKGGGDEDPSTLLHSSRSSSLKKSGGIGEDMSMDELSSGLLDLHSLDTELIPEVFILFIWWLL